MESMIIKSKYELIDVADEHLAVPVDSEATSFKGVVVLTEAASFLLKNMKVSKTKADLVKLLIDEFDVDEKTARNDVDSFIQKLEDLGMIE